LPHSIRAEGASPGRPGRLSADVLHLKTKSYSSTRSIRQVCQPPCRYLRGATRYLHIDKYHTTKHNTPQTIPLHNLCRTCASLRVT
jgi:hypothetical protein